MDELQDGDAGQATAVAEPPQVDLQAQPPADPGPELAGVIVPPPVPIDPLEALRDRLAKAYPQAVPRQLAHGLLASLQRYPEETLKLNMPKPLHVESNEHTVSWLMAVVRVLVPDEE